MFQKLQRKAFYILRQVLLTMHHQKYGKISHMIVNLIFGLPCALTPGWTLLVALPGEIGRLFAQYCGDSGFSSAYLAGSGLSAI